MYPVDPWMTAMRQRQPTYRPQNNLAMVGPPMMGLGPNPGAPYGSQFFGQIPNEAPPMMPPPNYNTGPMPPDMNKYPGHMGFNDGRPGFNTPAMPQAPAQLGDGHLLQDGMIARRRQNRLGGLGFQPL